MEDYLWLFDFGHGEDTPGKCSPPNEKGERYYEWRHTRRLGSLVVAKLKAAGENTALIVTETKDVPLKTRCARANAMYAKHGKKNCVLVSIHSNAAGSDGKWKEARGWCIYTSPGTTKADAVATSIWKAVETSLRAAGYNGTFSEAELKKGQRPMRADYSDGDPDYEARFTMLTGTAMPAVLIENLFHDNRKDLEFLTSERGMNALADGIVAGLLNYKKSQK